MAKRITPAQFETELRNRLRRDTKFVEEAALDAALRGERDAVALTDRKGLVDQSQFKLGWKHRRIPRGAELGNDAPHAPVIEYGRRPNRPGPPLAPIREWVYRKLVATGQVAEEDADGLAFVIRRAIHRRGLPPHRILHHVQRNLGRYLREAAIRRIKQAAAREQG